MRRNRDAVPIEKSEALVLRVIPFRDTSKILTVYTAEHGLVSLLAKGVRGPRPRFGGALELFAVADLVYYQKDTRELQLLSQALLMEPHLGLTRDLARYGYAAAVLEFLLQALSGQEPPGKLYALSLRTLEVLESFPTPSLPSLFRAFQIKAVSFLGHRPELFACVECRREGLREARFSPLLGGIACGDCAERIDGGVLLGAAALAWLRVLMTSRLADLEEDRAPAAVRAEAGAALEFFLAHHLERYQPLRALRLVQRLEPAA